MAQAGNVLFLYRNLGDDATASASSQVTGAEAAFAQTLDPGEPWRATGKTSETLTFDHGASMVDMTHAAAIYHNLSTQGTIRFRASNNSDLSSPLYDSGDVDAWDPVSGLGYDGFSTTLGGYPILSAFNDFRPLKLFDLGGRYTARYSGFTFKNPTNAAITGVAMGRAFVGLGVQTLCNFDFQWENQWVDPSDIIETESSVRVKARRKHRQLTLSMPNLKESEAITVWDDIKRAIGQSKGIVVVPFPTASAPKRYRTTIYGIPQDKQGTKQRAYDVFTSAITVRELAA